MNVCMRLSIAHLTFTAAVPLTLAIGTHELCFTFFTSLTFGQIAVSRIIILTRWATNQIAVRILFFINHQPITIVGLVILKANEYNDSVSVPTNVHIHITRTKLTKLKRTLFFLGKYLLISRS